jgi:hypothetical protein
MFHYMFRLLVSHLQVQFQYSIPRVRIIIILLLIIIILKLRRSLYHVTYKCIIIECTLYNNNSYSWYALLKLHLKMAD